MKRINKITLSALALPIAVVPAMVTSCNKQQTEAFEIDTKGLVTLKDKTLKEVTIPATINGIEVHGIATNGFKDTKVESVSFEKPDLITRIEDYAFAGCTSLKGISIPKNVKYLGIGAFSGCTSFETCNFAYGSILQTLKERTFENTNLYEIDIPGSIMTMEKNLFAYTGSSRLTKTRFSIKTGWSQINGAAIQESEMEPDNCSENFKRLKETDPHNWGYTGIKRTGKTANINYDESLDDIFYVTETKTAITEADDHLITFDLKTKLEKDNGEYIIWANSASSYTLNHTIYNVENNKITNVSLVIDDWSHIDDNSSLTIKVMKK